jgi:hypothetical protein
LSEARASATPSRSPLSELGRGAAWLLGIRGSLVVLDGLVPGSPLASSVLGALLTDIGVNRAGASWDRDPEVSRRGAIERFLRGLSLGTTLAASALLASYAFGWASVRLGRPDPMLLLALLAALGTAMREELLYRVLPLHFAARAHVPAWVALGFAASLSVAASALHPQSTLAGLALELGKGLLFASLAHHFRGAWAPIAAHTIWAFLLGAASRGGLLEVVYSQGELSDGALSAGAPAWFAAGLAVLLALFAVPRLSAAAATAAPEQPAAPSPAEQPTDRADAD